MSYYLLGLAAFVILVQLLTIIKFNNRQYLQLSNVIAMEREQLRTMYAVVIEVTTGSKPTLTNNNNNGPEVQPRRFPYKDTKRQAEIEIGNNS